MSKNFIYTNENSNMLFESNIKYLKNEIKNGNSNFILILPNRKIIKNIRNQFLTEQSILCDIKIWTMDDLVNAHDIADYLSDLIIRLSIQELIQDSVFENNAFFNSNGLIESAKRFISMFKDSNKNCEDLEDIKKSNSSLKILAKIYEKYENLMRDNNIVDKFDAYKIGNLNLQKNQDVYIHGFSEFRPIELEVIKELINRDVNVNIYFDYYSEYKSELVDKLKNIGFEIETQTSDLSRKAIREKNIKVSNEILEYDRLIYEISKDSYNYEYNKMAILLQKASSKRKVINKLKSNNIPVFSDDYICYSDFKIFVDIVKGLNTDQKFKQYILSLLDCCFIEVDVFDKVNFRKILIDFDFDNFDTVREIIKCSVNSEKNTEILNQLETYYDLFHSDDIIQNLINIIEEKEFDNSDYVLFSEKLNITLEELHKTFNELIYKLNNPNKYLSDIIKNLKVDNSDTIIDGVRIYNLTDIKLSNYDVLYVINMNDDVIPGKIKYNFFYNEENISVLKSEDIDILSDEDNRRRNIDRYLDAVASANNKIYISYSDEDSIKSRLISQEKILADKSIRKVNRNKIRKINLSNYNYCNVVHDNYSLKKHLNRFQHDNQTKDLSRYVVDDKITEQILNGYLSSTKLETFFDCKMKFYFRYYLELQPQENSRILMLGNALHNTLEEFYGMNIDNIRNAIDLKEELNISNLGDILKSSFEKFGLNTNIKENEYDYDKYLNRLSEFIKADVDKMSKEREKFYPYKLEEDFTIKIGDFKFKGRIDRIDKSENGNIRLIDYKTTKNSFKTYKDLEYNSGFQFAIYKSYGNVKSCKYMSIRDNEEVEFLEGITSAQLDDIVIDKSKKFTEELKAKDIFKPADDIKSCEYCDYNKICILRCKQGDNSND